MATDKPKLTIKIDPETMEKIRQHQEHLAEALAKVGSNITMEDLSRIENIGKTVAWMGSCHPAFKPTWAQERHSHDDDFAWRYGYAVYSPEPISAKRLREIADILDKRTRWEKLCGLIEAVRWWVHDHVFCRKDRDEHGEDW